MAGRNAPLPLYVTCPYDVNHKLAPRSYATHIDKCARTSKKVLSICKYNSLHRIEPALLEFHYAEECADRRVQIDDGWDDLPDQKPAPKSNEVDNLADALGAAAIVDWPTDPPTPVSASNSAELDDWNSGDRHNYLAPDFAHTNDAKPAKTYTMNRILVQSMTKSQKKKFYAEQLAQNLARIEKEKLEREGKEKRQEMEEKRKQDLLEQAAIGKEKQEREERRKELERKKKEKKERIKEAKRVAYLAATATETEKPDEQEKQKKEKDEKPQEKQT